MSTILKPTSGKMVIGGYDVESQPEKVRSTIGFLTGSTNLYNRLNPSEIVNYFGQLHSMPKDVLERRKDALFTQLGIHEFSQKKIGQMSTGMKQKVSIARSMIHNPDVVIFDEPTSGLDVITANSIIELIKRCKEEGKTLSLIHI